MKRYELEALFKNFFLFFSILSLLLFLLYWQNLKLQFNNLDKEIEGEMKLCSINLNCKNYGISFVKKDKNIDVNKLYKDSSDIYSYFNVPEAPKYLLKISYEKKSYNNLKDNIKNSFFQRYLIYAIMLSILSIIFSLYSLYPLKKALKINDEFVKDMLHDINTPLAAMNINLTYLEKQLNGLSVIDRLKGNYNSIIALQDNLKNFLDNSKLQKEEIDLSSFIDKSINNFKSIYKDVEFINSVENTKILTNKNALKRVVGNIIQNACKHNINRDLRVEIGVENNYLYIKDNGNGIKNINKIFTRGYTKSKRGLGLGLSIVKKLALELNIDIEVKSKVNNGTTFYLNLSKVIIR